MSDETSSGEKTLRLTIREIAQIDPRILDNYVSSDLTETNKEVEEIEMQEYMESLREENLKPRQRKRIGVRLFDRIQFKHQAAYRAMHNRFKIINLTKSDEDDEAQEGSKRTHRTFRRPTPPEDRAKLANWCKGLGIDASQKSYIRTAQRHKIGGANFSGLVHRPHPAVNSASRKVFRPAYTREEVNKIVGMKEVIVISDDEKL